jgi:hypothetical protein
MPTFWGYVAEYTGVVLLGGGVGLGELVSRYRGRPATAVTSAPGLLYIAINGAAAAGALALTLSYSWKFGATGESVTPTRFLVAGFGAMALFRSSLFTVRVGSQDVGIGPAGFLTVILAACDREVDRQQASDRADKVGKIMADVSYSKAADSLPAVAVALMQNLDPAEQTALSVALEKLQREPTMSDSSKALLLGLLIDGAVGREVLEEAKDALGAQIRRSPNDAAGDGASSEQTPADGASGADPATPGG